MAEDHIEDGVVAPSLEEAQTSVVTTYGDYKIKEKELLDAMDDAIKAIQAADPSDYLVWIVPELWMGTHWGPKPRQNLNIQPHHNPENGKTTHWVLIPIKDIKDVSRATRFNNRMGPVLHLDVLLKEKGMPNSLPVPESLQVLLGHQQLRIMKPAGSA